MRDKEKEELVKKLYEKYPYPNRKTSNKKELLKYGEWVSKIFGKDKSFWKGKQVLELGCGTGELANSLGLLGARVTGIDFSKSSLKKAREISKKVGTEKNVCFFEKNILEFASEKEFDVVIALGSLHHTVNARKGFGIACKHLKKNGFVIIGLYNKYSRFRHRVKRFFLFLLCGKNIEKRILLGKKFFGGIDNKAWLADKYGQVHESYHSVGEVLKWFYEEKIVFVASKPVFKKPLIDELKWFFGKKNAFFVMVGHNVKTS